jgi:predicted house-cleaning noncanonical NTP pyrophosphatase (MazG superfamily)
MTYYDKLVRDKIPQILKEKKKDFVAYRAPDGDYFPYLKRKLREEVDEFLESPSVEELADVYEVLSALLKKMDITMADVRTARVAKRDDRGAFDDRWILAEVRDG